MKCPSCGHNQKFSDGTTCGSCRHRFVFNPKVDKFTDGKMMALIRKASANDTYYFTFNQLYAEYCRRQAPGTCGCWAGALLLLVIAPAFMLWGSRPIGLGLAILGAVVGALAWHYRRTAPPDSSTLRGYLKRWEAQGIKGSLDKWLRGPRLSEPPPEWPESDIYDYGVERVLIVEHKLLVDLLVLNGFHAENRALVLSESGYPEYLLPRAAKVLNDRPDLPVFLLHDATPPGQAMAQRLTDSKLPLAGHRVIDTGLCLQDIPKLKGLRRINAHKLKSGVPVDMLIYSGLSLTLAAALTDEMTFAALLTQQAHPGSDSGGSYG